VDNENIKYKHIATIAIFKNLTGCIPFISLIGSSSVHFHSWVGWTIDTCWLWQTFCSRNSSHWLTTATKPHNRSDIRHTANKCYQCSFLTIFTVTTTINDIHHECPTYGPPGVSIRPARSPRNVKNDRFVSISCVFFQALKYAKTRFLPGLCPRPRWGSLRHSPRPHSQLGRGHPLPIPFSLDAFGISIWPRLVWNLYTLYKFGTLVKKVGHPWYKWTNYVRHLHRIMK